MDELLKELNDKELIEGFFTGVDEMAESLDSIDETLKKILWALESLAGTGHK